jgi:Peptidase E
MNTILLSKNLGIIKEYLFPKNKVGFIPTAGEVYANPLFVIEDRIRLINMGYDVIDIDITNIDKNTISSKLKNIDALFVSGGNVFYLMQQIRKKNVEKEISNFINSEKLYIGASAGGCICSPVIEPYKLLDNMEEAKELSNLNGLNIINFVILPHYGKEKYMHLYDEILEQYKDQYKLVFLRDDEALVLKSNKEYDIVSSVDIII